MKDINFKNLTPYLVALVVFLTITFVYFYPVLEGKSLKMHDIKMWKGMSKEISDFREATGEEALWTNSMFGGMPAWQISVHYSGNLMKHVDKLLRLYLPFPASYVFLYFLGFFVLLLVLRINPWVSIVGAIAFALSSYFFIILGAGHATKAHAIAYMAPVLAGIILTFRGKYLWGALLTSVALSLEILATHLQITYYLLILVIVYGIYQLIKTIQNGEYLHFAKASGILILAAIIAVLTFTTNLWGTYEYGKDTMRGKPELTKSISEKSSGLDKDYITAWSYGIGETWSFLIPNAKGGASGLMGNIPELKNAEPAYRKAIAQQSSQYWGDQPGTSGPVYAGALVAFLFLLGLFIVSDKLKWALLAATILSIMLGWGKNFMPLTDFFIDYVPGYAKFRAVSMILVIAELTIPLLAFMALNKIFTEPKILSKKITISSFSVNVFYLVFGITAGLLLLFYIFPDVFFRFLNTQESIQFAQLMQGEGGAQYAAFAKSIEAVRIGIFRNDILRSLAFIIGGAGLIKLFALGKINKTVFLGVLAILVLADMFAIDKRYLNNEKSGRNYKMWESRQTSKNPFIATKADNIILQDKDPDFRVLDLTKNTFNDASTSYFHKSIGGYHGAKLQRYQDLIEHNISGEISSVIGGLSSGIDARGIDELLKKQQVLNMLNTKYFIYSPEAAPLVNNHAFGNAWIVSNYKLVNNADEEIAALKTTDLKTTAIVDIRFENNFDKGFSKETNGDISLTSYAPNKLEYTFDAPDKQMVIFSEIYYEKGWKAFIDGEESEYFRANYILRGMTIPAGKHQIVFKFEPKVWVIGEKVSFASSLLLIILILGGAFIEIKKNYLN